MIKTTTNVTVRYAETDKMGIVYHANYAQYLELGRTDWLKQCGFSYKEMEENGVHLPVVNLNINFKKPAHYDDDLIIHTSIRKIPTRKIEFDYEIFNQKDELLVTGSTVLVFINSVTNKIINAPTYLLEHLAKK